MEISDSGSSSTSEPAAADSADGLEGATGLKIAAARSEVLVDPESDSIKLIHNRIYVSEFIHTKLIITEFIQSQNFYS